MIYEKVRSLELVTGKRTETSKKMPTTLCGLPVEEDVAPDEELRRPDRLYDSDADSAARSGGGDSGEDWLAEGKATDETVNAIKHPAVKSTRCTALPPGTFAQAILTEPSNLHGRSAEARCASGYMESFRSCGFADGETLGEVYLAHPLGRECARGAAAEATAVATMQRDFFRRVDDFEVGGDSLKPLSEDMPAQTGRKSGGNDVDTKAASTEEILTLWAAGRPRSHSLVLESVIYLLQNGVLNIRGTNQINAKQACAVLHAACWVQALKSEEWIRDGSLPADRALHDEAWRAFQMVLTGAGGTGKTVWQLMAVSLGKECLAFRSLQAITVYYGNVL